MELITSNSYKINFKTTVDRQEENLGSIKEIESESISSVDISYAPLNHVSYALRPETSRIASSKLSQRLKNVCFRGAFKGKTVKKERCEEIEIKKVKPNRNMAHIAVQPSGKKNDFFVTHFTNLEVGHKVKLNHQVRESPHLFMGGNANVNKINFIYFTKNDDCVTSFKNRNFQESKKLNNEFMSKISKPRPLTSTTNFNTSEGLIKTHKRVYSAVKSHYNDFEHNQNILKTKISVEESIKNRDFEIHKQKLRLMSANNLNQTSRINSAEVFKSSETLREVQSAKNKAFTALNKKKPVTTIDSQPEKVLSSRETSTKFIKPIKL